MNNEEKILMILENLQKQITSLEKTTNEKFGTMKGRFDTMESRFDIMEKSTSDRFDALEKFIIEENEITREELKSEIQNVYEEVQDLKDNFNEVETMTARNWLDICKLKAAK